jgi:hypothetical protein
MLVRVFAFGVVNTDALAISPGDRGPHRPDIEAYGVRKVDLLTTCCCSSPRGSKETDFKANAHHPICIRASNVKLLAMVARLTVDVRDFSATIYFVQHCQRNADAVVVCFDL